jgi:hypothetical protein
VQRFIGDRKVSNAIPQVGLATNRVVAQRARAQPSS